MFESCRAHHILKDLAGLLNFPPVQNCSELRKPQFGPKRRGCRFDGGGDGLLIMLQRDMRIGMA
jgi:hypothetical protein